MGFKKTLLKGGNEKIVCAFGRRKDPITGKWSTHRGIDVVNGDASAKVIAVADGIVQATRNTYKGKTTDGSAGNYIILQHDGYDTVYYHLKKDSLLVKKGDKVKAGQEIATIGTTGHSTGIHLHFGIDDERGAGWVDPVPYLNETNTANVHGNTGANPKLIWGDVADEEVKSLQVWFNTNLKARILADGVGGSRTYAFARKYKIKHSVDCDVSKWVQQRLKTMGLYNGLVDGKPRSLTTSAIKAFEKRYSLKEDGCISGSDWYYLIAWEGK